MCPQFRSILAVLIVAASSSAARGETLFVDNVVGNTGNNGLSRVSTAQHVGPVPTINQALRLADQGDTIVVNNTGIPYYESLSLVGRDNSGFASVPFTVIGNGAIVSGAQQIDARAFQNVRGELFRLNPWRKDYFLLLRDGAVVSELKPVQSMQDLEQLAPGQWASLKGQMYYRTRPLELFENETYAVARHSTGLTMYGVHHVVIRGLTFQHFRIDGVNAHDLVHSCVLEDVTTTENARAGVTVNGTSTLKLQRVISTGNREDSVRITELGQADLVECKIDTPVRVDQR